MVPPQGFFLGLGAQKSGTTWLARYLDDWPEMSLPLFKEVHYWTSKYTRHQRNAVRSARRLPGVELPCVAGQMLEVPRRAGAIAATYAGNRARTSWHRSGAKRSS